MSELIPCPFCGGKNVLSTELQDGLPFIAYCQCGAENEAENWNNRPIEDELRKRIAELEGFINQLIEAGELLAECSDYEGGKIAWDALVKDWKEREE